MQRVYMKQTLSKRRLRCTKIVPEMFIYHFVQLVSIHSFSIIRRNVRAIDWINEIIKIKSSSEGKQTKGVYTTIIPLLT